MFRFLILMQIDAGSFYPRKWLSVFKYIVHDPRQFAEYVSCDAHSSSVQQVPDIPAIELEPGIHREELIIIGLGHRMADFMLIDSSCRMISEFECTVADNGVPEHLALKEDLSFSVFNKISGFE